MVDLVKLRKKAKKAAEQLPVAEEPAPEPPATDELTADSTQHSAPSTQHPALSTQHSADGTQHSADSTQHSAPSTQHLTSSESKLEKFKEGAGLRREGLVVESETDNQTTEIIELLTFVIAGENYAVHIENIVEIVTPRPVTRIPNADTSIVGIISLRGTIVTLLDARRKLRHPPADESPDTRVVVLEHRGETVGFEVDRVLRVVKTDRGAIEPHPVVHSSELDDAIRGVFRQANALTILLDLDKLLGNRGHAATQEVIAARR